MNNLMNQFLEKQKKQKVNIHCVGDAMIDEYYQVSVNRISPEFPMPIMHSEEENPIRKPGGVANVVYQFRHFNTDSRLICFSDTQATIVFREHSLNYQPCTSHTANIPRKKRFLDHGIQVKRWDIEKKNSGLTEPKSAREDALQMTEHHDPPDVAILSDYDKGFFDPEYAQKWIKRYKNSITIVDPKHGPATMWKGCTVFKPNAKEAENLSGLSDPQAQCEYFAKKLGCKGVVITQGGDGLVGMVDGEYFKYYSQSSSTQPASVIGAGDCFSAFLAQSVALGFTIKESAEIAYEAGAIYIHNKMNRPIVPAELIKDKLVQAEDLKNRDFKLVFTNGCFDLLHRGHLQTLEFAKQHGEKLVVALNSDDSVRRLKGEDRPVKLLAERQAVMSALDMVDFVISFEEDTPYEAIKACNPDVLIKGADYSQDEIIGSDLVKEVHCAPLIDGLSTTGLLTRGWDLGGK